MKPAQSNLSAQGLMILANWLRQREGKGSIRSTANLAHPAHDVSPSHSADNITLASHGLLSINGPLPRVYQEWVMSERHIHKNDAAHRLLDILAQPLTLKDLAAWSLTRPAAWATAAWPVSVALSTWAGHAYPETQSNLPRTLRLNFHGQTVQRTLSQEAIERMVSTFTGQPCRLKPLQYARHVMPAQGSLRLGQPTIRLGGVRLGTTVQLRSSRVVFDFSNVEHSVFLRLTGQESASGTGLGEVLKNLLPNEIEPICSASLNALSPMTLSHTPSRLGINSMLGRQTAPVVVKWNPYRIAITAGAATP